MPDWLQNLLQSLILGLSTGAIYALIAVGYTMVYGILRLINFAHGDVYMVGAMTAYFVGTSSFNVFGSTLSTAILIGLFVLLGVIWAGLSLGMGARGPKLGVEVSRALFVGVGAVMFAGLMSMMLGMEVGVARAATTLPTGASGAETLPTAAIKAYLFSPWAKVGVALVSSMILCGAMGMVIELLAYRPLRRSPRINSLITAIGVSMLLMYGGQAVFGATPRPFPVPNIAEPFLFKFGQDLQGNGGISLGKLDAMIIGVTVGLMLVLRYIVLHTKTGMALRAVSFRFDTASLMGINIDRIISFTFVLGSMLAAAAGVLIALKFPRVDPLMGLMMGLKAFVAAVLGGIGNIAGAVLGAFLLGITEVLVVTYVDGGSQWRDGVAFAILIAVLLLKPSGLLGGKVVEKV